MGYRSEVCFAVNKELFDKSDIKDLEILSRAEKIETDKAYYFRWPWTSWDGSILDSESYKIECFNGDHPEESALLRLGESIDDNEFLGATSEFELYLNRKMFLPVRGHKSIRVEHPYVYIEDDRYPHRSYQLKADDEGLILDVVDGNHMEELFACADDEMLVCDKCGKADCDYDCDESQMSTDC